MLDGSLRSGTKADLAAQLATPGVPVVLLTGYRAPRHVLRKPVTQGQLVAAVGAALAEVGGSA